MEYLKYMCRIIYMNFIEISLDFLTIYVTALSIKILIVSERYKYINPIK